MEYGLSLSTGNSGIFFSKSRLWDSQGFFPDDNRNAFCNAQTHQIQKYSTRTHILGGSPVH